MGPTQWSDALKLGIDEIDQQHRKLLSLIDELNEAMRQGKGKDILGKITTELDSYTKYHFKSEERLFSNCGFPEAVSHKKIHDDFVQKVTGFKKDFDSGKLGVATDILLFLNNWLINHIKGLDKKYVPFVTEKCAK